MGSSPWMPPEQFIDASSCDERSDIYSFGIVLYQLCSGRLPFVGRSFDEYRYMHTTQIIPKIDSPLFPVIEKCCAKRRHQRYQSFRALKIDLEAIAYYTGIPYYIQQRASESRGAAMRERYNQAVSFYVLRQYNKALKAYISVLENNPCNEDAWYGIGLLLGELGFVEEANISFECYIRIKCGEAEIAHLQNVVQGILQYTIRSRER